MRKLDFEVKLTLPSSTISIWLSDNDDDQQLSYGQVFKQIFTFPIGNQWCLIDKIKKNEQTNEPRLIGKRLGIIIIIIITATTSTTKQSSISSLFNNEKKHIVCSLADANHTTYIQHLDINVVSVCVYACRSFIQIFFSSRGEN